MLGLEEIILQNILHLLQIDWFTLFANAMFP